MAPRLSPIGFWSYARQDDEFSNGKLSSLRAMLRAELQQQYGREPISLFQDVAAIPPGSEWDEEIRNALTKATFCIPIITPNFVESEWCNQEVQVFLERERDIIRQHPELKGRRRVFPINYIDAQDAEPHSPELMKELLRLQWFDLRPLRFKDQRDEAVQLALSRLAATITKLLQAQVGLMAAAAAREEAIAVPAPMAKSEAPRPAPQPEPAAARAPPEPVVPEPAVGGGWRRHQDKLLLGALALGAVALVVALAHPGLGHRQAAAAAAAADVPPAVRALAGRWTPLGDVEACATGQGAIDIVIQAGAANRSAIRLNGGAAEPLDAARTDGWLGIDRGLWRVEGGTLQIVADDGDRTKPAEYRRCG
jgi:hypothetical protein